MEGKMDMASASNEDIKIRVIVFKDGDQWVAQCLEYDIGAQSSDLDALNERLFVVLKAELRESLEHGGKPFEGIEPAPKRFEMMWDRRVRSIKPVTETSWAKEPVSLDFAFAA